MSFTHQKCSFRVNVASLLQNAPEGVEPETCGAQQPFSGFVLNERMLFRRLAWILGASWNILDLISQARYLWQPYLCVALTPKV